MADDAPITFVPASVKSGDADRARALVAKMSTADKDALMQLVSSGVDKFHALNIVRSQNAQDLAREGVDAENETRDPSLWEKITSGAEGVAEGLAGHMAPFAAGQAAAAKANGPLGVAGALSPLAPIAMGVNDVMHPEEFLSGFRGQQEKQDEAEAQAPVAHELGVDVGTVPQALDLAVSAPAAVPAALRFAGKAAGKLGNVATRVGAAKVGTLAGPVGTVLGFTGSKAAGAAVDRSVSGLANRAADAFERVVQPGGVANAVADTLASGPRATGPSAMRSFAQHGEGASGAAEREVEDSDIAASISPGEPTQISFKGRNVVEPGEATTPGTPSSIAKSGGPPPAPEEFQKSGEEISREADRLAAERASDAGGSSASSMRRPANPEDALPSRTPAASRGPSTQADRPPKRAPTGPIGEGEPRVGFLKSPLDDVSAVKPGAVEESQIGFRRPARDVGFGNEGAPESEDELLNRAVDMRLRQRDPRFVRDFRAAMDRDVTQTRFR